MATKLKQISSEMIHVGSIVQQHMAKCPYNQTQIGRMIGTSSINVGRYAKEKSLQCYILWNLSKVFKTNLFEPIGEALNLPKPSTISPNEIMLQQRVADLEKELAIYKEIVLKSR